MPRSGALYAKPEEWLAPGRIRLPRDALAIINPGRALSAYQSNDRTKAQHP